MRPFGSVIPFAAVTLAWQLAAPAIAAACSCASSAFGGGFVIEDGAELPRNIGGFPWWGPLRGDVDGKSPLRPPPRGWFRLERLGRGSAGAIPFTLDFEDPLSAKRFRRRQDPLVRPT